ncbi:MAG: hypothetical protein IAE94_07440 [Chthoniobacterales bacterium]|jgi:hypothetical protein|nr:hypothetical protein [Chthoniobacterales bacterium]
MFNQVEFASWSGLITLIAFLVSFSVFVTVVVGAMRCSKQKVRHLAEMPLGEEKRS